MAKGPNAHASRKMARIDEFILATPPPCCDRFTKGAIEGVRLIEAYFERTRFELRRDEASQASRCEFSRRF